MRRKVKGAWEYRELTADEIADQEEREDRNAW
jgi:hypothetical protein